MVPRGGSWSSVEWEPIPPGVLSRLKGGLDAAGIFPTVCALPGESPAMHYYTIDHDNAVCGPYTPRQLLDLWQDGTVTDSTAAAVAGDSVWQPLKVLLTLVREDAEIKTVPLEDAHFQRHVRAAMETGPPTSPVLLKLLKEDGPFPRPRKPRD